MMPRRPVRFSLPGTCARASDKGGPTPNFVSALRGQAEALPTAYVSELDDRTTRLGRATSYNMHGDGWSTCRRTPVRPRTLRETGRRIIPSHVASIRGVRHRLNEFLPRSFDAACPSDRWHDTADFKRAKNRDDHPCIACSLLRNGRAAW